MDQAVNTMGPGILGEGKGSRLGQDLGGTERPLSATNTTEPQGWKGVRGPRTQNLSGYSWGH